MSRIRIDDLPAVSTLTPEEMAEIFGAGSRSFQPTFETLEDRQLMTGGLNASLSSGVLHITGTSSADVFDLRRSSDQISLQGTQISVNGVMQNQIPASTVKLIEVNGQGGADTFWLNKGSQPLATGVVIDGIVGPDTVYPTPTSTRGDAPLERDQGRRGRRRDGIRPADERLPVHQRSGQLVRHEGFRHRRSRAASCGALQEPES